MKKYWLLMRVVVGISILSFLYAHIGIDNILATLANASLFIILLMFIQYVFSFLLSAFNLHLMLKALGHPIPFPKLAYCNMKSWALGLFVPGKVGEFSIIYFLKKQGIPVDVGSAVSLADKLITLFVLAVFACVGTFIFFGSTAGIVISSLVIIGVVVGYWIIFISKLGKMVKQYLPFLKAAEGFSKQIKVLKGKTDYIGANLVLTILKWVVMALISAKILMLLGALAPWPIFLMADATTRILSLIPITLAGLGIKESSGIYLLSIAGVSFAASGAFYLLFLMANLLLAVIVLLTKD
ncbi:flippase-like domain-containing protein [Candidatus Woesearchaeota archaeon]|nr:flippase-like domain-containing protein [Candidatus Woesearchaeota archaeon]HIH37605.1 flippase-like domain-containing protein [Candidatus Woesearchaeota archaeon]HIH48725.1 flippase-like domain-containing protein [Candidatus Woesearchaeota archaeon]HIJ03051.1 flippase-like domain-containing protein [Candidatus Woesearchaeota archaeon]